MDTDTLAQLFSNPPAAYRPMIFWLWNGDITPEGIEAQVADFAAKGCGGFFLHPMGESFRLGDFVRGMGPAYLSDEFFALVRQAVEAAQRHGLYAWLYDEGGWPSGGAQGQVLAGHPEFAAKRLRARRIQTLDLAPVHDSVIAAVGLPEIGVPEPVDLRELSQGLRPYNDLIVFSLEEQPETVDVLNPQAVRRFIDLTHERYAEHVGEFFGDTVPGIFTDETSLTGRLGGETVPWFGGMLELLAEQMGRDPRSYLPLLFSADLIGAEVFARYSDHEAVAARCEYYEVLTRRFGDSYWRQISGWCAQHGLIHTGHVGGEDNLPDHLHFGHFFRTAGALHVPGVDAIWRQLFPGQRGFPFPRFAASAAKQRGAGVVGGTGVVGGAGYYPARRSELSPLSDLDAPSASDGGPADSQPLHSTTPWQNAVLTETNAAYGFGLHYGQMRWLLDAQAQHGVNLFAPMASYYDATGGRLYGTMSHIGPGNPLWPYYRAFADYAARVCLLARQGPERAKVAVYYPVEALWTIDGAEEAWHSLQHICDTLMVLHVPFDFVDADLLPELQVEIGQGVRGDLTYTTFIVPTVLAMPASAMGKLAELREAAAEVIFVEHWPLQAAEMDGLASFDQALGRLQQAEATVIPVDHLRDLVRTSHLTDYEVLSRSPELLISSRPSGDDRVFLLTNNSDEALEPAVSFDLAGRADLEIWDLRDGEVVALPWQAGDHPQQFQPIVAPWSSVAAVARATDAPRPRRADWPAEALELERWLADPENRPRTIPPADVIAEFEFADRARIAKQYVIAGGAVEPVPEADLPGIFPTQSVPLRDWDQWPLTDFSGEVEYEFELTVAEELLQRQLLLDLGVVRWVARVELNGRQIGDLLWAPYTIDVSNAIVPGTNLLRLTVANTLANQACRPEVEQEARERGWCNIYFERTLPMMREDLRSGLIGPVRLMATRCT